MITVRPAQPGDGDAVLQMIFTLAKSHDMAQHFVATAADYERELFKPDTVIGALVALVGEQPAGCAVWHRSFSTNRGCETMYLEDLVVLPEFRRKGVGHELLRHVAKLAITKGYPSFYWVVMDWNVGALDLYKRVGAELHDGMSMGRIHGAALEALAT